MAPLRSPLRIDRLEVENFKSYKGTQTIGPMKDFTAVIGPNVRRPRAMLSLLWIPRPSPCPAHAS